MNVLTGAFKWYTHQLSIMPIRTKCITTFFIYGTGDLICQYMERYQDKSRKINPIRALRQATFGFIISPYIHFQFCIALPYLFPTGTNYRVLKMIAYDQTIATTIFHIGYFIWLDLSAGKSFKQMSECLSRKVYTAVTSSWGYWPFIQFFNFSYTPIQFRVQVSNFFGILWSAYISYVQNVKHKH
jgi:protein Mpv17